jgi:ABC-2 type transport system permease protein
VHKKARRGAGRRRRAAGTGFPGRLLPPQVLAILGKDSMELRRNLRNLSQLVSPFVMGVVFSVMLLRSGGVPPEGRGEAPAAFMEAFRLFLAYGSMAVSLFVGWSVVTNLGLISFSMEHQSYWILKTAPVSGGRLLAAKFLMAYLPGLALGWVFLLALALVQKVAVATVLYSLPAIALSLAGLTGMELSFGVRAANFTWTDPRHMGGGGAGCLALIAGGIYLVMAAALFFGPPIAAPLLGIGEGFGQVAGFLLGGAFALACAVLPLRMVLPRVARLAED